MTAKTTLPKVKLDWSRLLGFDQAAPSDDQRPAPRLSDPRLAKLGAKSGVKPISDVRLKTDIRQVGTAAHDLPLYSFRYIGEDGVYEGVMAQDVLAVMPEAVSIAEDGYYRVDYEMLGIELRRMQ